MEKHFPEVKVIKLEQNYRSTNTILHAANAVIKNNARRRGKQLWSAKGQGNKITLHAFTDDEEEARVVVEEIEFKRMARRVAWGDQAILFRTNQQSRPLEAALRKAGVRYHLIGGQSYFDRREVKDFIAYLKVFLNPHDDISLLRIANTPARGLSDVTMERLLAASQERHCSVFTAMRHTDVLGAFPARTRESIQEFVQRVEQQRHWLENAVDHPSPALRAPSPLVGQGESEGTNVAASLSSPSPFAQRGERDGVRGAGLALSHWAGQFITDIGYFNEIRRSEKNPEVAESRIMNLKDLMAMLDNASGPTDKPVERLSSFLDDLSLDAERAEDKEHAGDAVTLITMHSCKGLEYPHVFIVGLEDGLLPHSRSKVEGTLDEERRLFYVAITRAQETLTISHCGGRKRYGQLLPCHPSRFLKELPADLVESAEERNTPVSTSEGKDLFAAMRAALG
jgi:DNA helicase II / ATP-dependent DNA helicase PcrA